MTNFTKDNLETGMVVELRNRNKYLVVKGNFHTEFYSKQEIMFIANDDFMPGG